MKIPPSLLGINLVWVGECYHLNLYGLRRHSVFLLICVAKGQSSPSLYSPTPVRAWKRKFYMGFPRSEWTGESPFGAATSPESPAAEHFDLWETGAKHYQPSSFSSLFCLPCSLSLHSCDPLLCAFGVFALFQIGFIFGSTTLYLQRKKKVLSLG